MATAHLLHQGAWLLFFFFRFFFKKIHALSYKLIFAVYFLQLTLRFTNVSFCSALYMNLARAAFFISYFWAIMKFEVYGGQITKIYHGLCYLMPQVLKRNERFSLHLNKWTQCYTSFWNLLISNDTLLVCLEVIFQGDMKVL